MIRLGALVFRRRSVVVIGILVVLMMAATTLGLLEALDLRAVNLAFRLRGAQPPTTPIVIVAIDDNTFVNANLQWPWPRTYFAQLVDRLAEGGAKVIALDVFFTNPEDLGKPATYSVRGETLDQIAAQYDVTPEAIREKNSLPADRGLCPGQLLTIPTQPPVEHVVIGDTLADIAARYQIGDLTRLMAANALSDPCDIHRTSGSLLRIPVLEGKLDYPVQAGDTVESIAAQYQINPLAIITEDHQPAHDPLTPGQTVTVQFGDAAFTASIKAAGNVTLIGQKISLQEGGSVIETLNSAWSPLYAAAAGFGLTKIVPDSDGAVHQIQAWDAINNQVFYAWPAVVASLYTGQSLGANPSPGGFTLGDKTIPLNRNNLRINYLGPEGTISTYSAFQVVNGDLPPETFRDKIVLIGATTESLHDTYPTPFDHQNPTPGVEIMGNVLETILSTSYLSRIPLTVALLAVLLAGGITLALTFIRRTRLAALALFSLMAVYVMIWLAAFLALRLEIPLIAPEFTLFVCAVASFLERALNEALEKRRVRNIFELFISPELLRPPIEQGIDATRTQRAELSPLVSNPYIAGNPITGETMFFGRADVFEFIQRTLVGRHQDHPLVLYGQRRTGKTSMLYQIARRIGEPYVPILVDLHGLSLTSEAGFYSELAGLIRRVLRKERHVEAPPLAREALGDEPVVAFREKFLAEMWTALGDGPRLLLMFDEAIRFDEVVRDGHLSPDFFKRLRSLIQNEARLDFIFALGSGLEQLEREYAFLFSSSLYKRISFLDRTAATALITEPVRPHYGFVPGAIQRILQITSGHPYFTQLICHSLFARWQSAPHPTLGVAEIEAVLEEVVERGTASLKYNWEEATPAERAVLAGLSQLILRLLNDEEARDLVTHSLAPTGVTFTSEEHVWLGEVAGGYPYFLQAACHFLFDAHTQSPDSAARQKYALKEFREEAFPHFSDYWLHSDDGEKITLTMLALLSHGGRASERRFHLGRLRDLYERSELVLIELDKRGLVRRDTDAFALFSTAFSEWILNEIKASTDEKQTYETWLASNEGAVGRLSKHLAEEVKTQVLPQIKTAYRDLIIGWLSNPQTIASAVTLLSNALR